MKQESQKNIDELFKSKVKNFEYTHKDSSWQLMNHLLKESSRKKSILFFSIGLALTVASLATVLFVFNTKTEKQTELVNSDEVNEEKANNQIDSIKNIRQASNDSEDLESSNKNIDKNKVIPGFHNQVSSSIENNQSKNNDSTSSLDKEIVSTSDVYIPRKNDTFLIKDRYLESYAENNYKEVNSESINVEIQNIGQHVNSPFADYAPVINADGSILYFTSRRPVTDKQKKKNKEASESIYSTSFNRELGTWSDAKKLPQPINHADRFNSIIGLSGDGEHMLLYRDDKFGIGNIYESNLNGDQWSDPVRLPDPINSKHIETSASISPDGKTIYFVSNRPGGQGSLDIWYSTKNNDGEWGEAKNLGDVVNTPEKEEGVFIHPDGKTLYFSSKGHGGEGGYDIFYTKLKDGEWSKPKNLGKKVNSPDDDVYFVMAANGKVGYYSSIREDGYGEKDIYRIEFTTPETEEEEGPQLTLFKGLVVDKETNNPLDAEIEIIDLEINEQITSLKTNSKSGNFLISLPSGKNYGINVKKEGYLFYSDNMNIPEDASYEEIIKTVMLERLKEGSKIILKNIFYDYDKATLRNQSKNELDRLYNLLISNPNLKVELSSHTDSRGSDAYNKKLSQERAQSCVDYLISKGINKERIIAKGYGKQEILRTDEEINQHPSKETREKLHLENRRTEFKVLENKIN